MPRADRIRGHKLQDRQSLGRLLIQIAAHNNHSSFVFIISLMMSSA